MKYKNPIIKGFHPDPSICRVKAESRLQDFHLQESHLQDSFLWDYYLVTSSFEYFPGIPVYHSTDLVNWKQIGNCINYENKLDLSKVKESGGIWAPTIRYEKGTFYVTAAMEKLEKNQFGNFIIHTKDIYGTWSEPSWVAVGGIDPSLFFEDGKAYYCTNESTKDGKENIRLGVVNPDTGEILEEFRPIWYGAGGGWLEAPHIYHIGEWYYLLCAEGGTFHGHHEVAARAKNIWGPYESCPFNPILTNQNDTSKQVNCCGHGDLVEDGKGNWWMVHLGCRPGKAGMSPLGRETFLTQIVWKEEWPLAGSGCGRVMEEGPLMEGQYPGEEKKDDFKSPIWPLWWCFVRNPMLFRYMRGDGRLGICPSGRKPDGNRMEGFVCVRQPDIDFTMEVTLMFRRREGFLLKEADAAGLLLWLNHEFYCFFGVRMHEGERELFLERRAEDFHTLTWSEGCGEKEATGMTPEKGREAVLSEEGEEKAVRLAVKGGRDEYVFGLIQPDGSFMKKCSASSRFLSTGVADRCFTGTMAGLYAESAKETGAFAVFADFRIRGNNDFN